MIITAVDMIITEVDMITIDLNKVDGMMTTRDYKTLYTYYI